MATDRAVATVVPFVPRARPNGATVVSDYWALTKPDVTLLVAITTAAGFCLGARMDLLPLPWFRFLHAMVGTVLVAGGAAALNQWMERGFDARMRRTSRRPVASGRITPGQARMFGTLLSLAGVAYLLATTGMIPASLAAGTLLVYLLLYTPAKRRTPLCTLIGAVPGAMPPLIGWAAARGRLDPEAWMLFAIVFLWQFPHFMAIAWMYRDDYDRAGYHVLPAGEARLRFVTEQTLLAVVALVPVSLLPLVAGYASPLYGLGAVILGVGFADRAARFALRASAPAARQLLLASVVYLPVLFALLTALRSGDA
ncbi:MAG TPA: heme o synthase [Vicinamibacteria bacterium]|jgi:protoheme IX farnesyltransferase